MEAFVETKCAEKVSFFIWTVALGKILTIDESGYCGLVLFA